MASVEAARRLLAKARQDEFDDLHHLTPFAVDYRYEYFEEELDKPLDRPEVLKQVRRLRAWVEVKLATAENSGHG